jgi:hypothetical protein
MTRKAAIGGAWVLSCALAGAAGWLGRAGTAPGARAPESRKDDENCFRISGDRRVRLQDRQGRLMLILDQGPKGHAEGVTAYGEGDKVVFFTTHYEDGTVKEFALFRKGKTLRTWSFREDGSVGSTALFDERGRGKVQFYDEAGKPAGTGITTLRCVD